MISGRFPAIPQGLLTGILVKFSSSAQFQKHMYRNQGFFDVSPECKVSRLFLEPPGAESGSWDLLPPPSAGECGGADQVKLGLEIVGMRQRCLSLLKHIASRNWSTISGYAWIRLYPFSIDLRILLSSIKVVRCPVLCYTPSCMWLLAPQRTFGTTTRQVSSIPPDGSPLLRKLWRHTVRVIQCQIQLQDVLSTMKQMPS